MLIHRRSRQVSAIVLAFVLLVAACSDDTGSETSPGTSVTTTETTADTASTTTTAAVSQENGRGVTDETIKVGIITYDWDRLAALGIDFGRTNATDLYLAAIDEINDRGGINGRMLEPFARVFLPVGPVEADRVCVELTEDEEVFVVIGITLGDQVLCFLEQHETAVVAAGGMTVSRVERANAPFVTIVDSVEERTAEFLRIMREAGVLDDATVGVLGSVDVSIENYDAMIDAVRAEGLDPVEGLIGGNAEDLGASAREQDVIAERMKDSGVNVTIETTGVPLAVFNAMEAGYTSEQWLLAALMSGRALTEAGIPHEYLDGALAGANTTLGTSLQPSSGDDPVIAACVDDLRARTGNPLPYELEPAVNDLAEALLVCAMADVLEAGLLNAGPIVNNDTFQAGLDAIGDIELPGYLDASIGPGDYGAAKGLRLVRFDAASGAWMPVE